LKAGETDFIVC